MNTFTVWYEDAPPTHLYSETTCFIAIVRQPCSTAPAQATRADAVADSYFQLGGNFFAFCMRTETPSARAQLKYPHMTVQTGGTFPKQIHKTKSYSTTLLSTPPPEKVQARDAQKPRNANKCQCFPLPTCDGHVSKTAAHGLPCSSARACGCGSPQESGGTCRPCPCG